MDHDRCTSSAVEDEKEETKVTVEKYLGMYELSTLREDPRNLFPFAIERKFKYEFDTGTLKTSFTPPPKARVKAVIFREVKVENPDKVVFLKYTLDDCDYRGVSVDYEEIRSHLRDEYAALKESAETEILDLQRKPAGVAVFAAIEAFEPPETNFIGDYPVKLENFPYNFGVLTTEKVQQKLQFFCRANETCRCKPTILRLTKTDWTKNETVILAHLQGMHWQQLIQTGYA